MSNARNLADVISGNYDVPAASLDNAPTPTLSSLGIANHDAVTIDASGAISGAASITFDDATSQSTAAQSEFGSGVVMMFQQTAAPTGWTKQTTHNDKALRVVSGTCSSGGSVAFSTAMGTPSVDTSAMSAGSHTLTSAQMPSHNHSIPAYYGASGGTGAYGPVGGTGAGYTDYTNSTGGNGSHSHSISGAATATINCQYVDIIIATKD